MVCPSERSGRWLEYVHLPASHLNHEGSAFHIGSIISWFVICTIGRVHGKHATSYGRYDVVTHIDSYSLEMFLWKMFPAIAPKPMEFSMVNGEVALSDGSRGMRP